ncbi:MAG: hypothetical protein ACOC7Y_02205, partial [Chloroflexota bacterium]
MTLRRGAEQPGQLCSGPGSISLSEKGEIQFKMYASVPRADQDGLFRLSGKAGRIVDQSELWTLSAVDTQGRTWFSRPMFPRSEKPSAGDILVVTGTLDELAHKVEYADYQYRLVEPTLRFAFPDGFDFPCNAATEATTSIAGSEAHRSVLHNVARFEACGYDFTMRRTTENGLLLDVQARDGGLHPGLDVRIAEALQFAFGRRFEWRLLERHEGSDCHTYTIRPAARREIPSNARSPLRYDVFRGRDYVYSLFSAYLAFILPHPGRDWHPLSAIVHSMISAGEAPVDAQALSLSVAAEAISLQLFKDTAPRDEQFLEDLASTQRALAELGLQDRSLCRIHGSLGSMRRTTATHVLQVLQGKGVIEKRHVNAWKKLRNAYVHPERPFAIPLQELVDLSDAVAVLCHHLVFQAIGYRGKY